MTVKVLPIVIFAVAIASLSIIGWALNWPPQWADILGQAAISPLQIGQLVITFVLLAASLFVILSKRYAPTDRHWAYGTVGTLIGFWLKG
jgi:hypothetical protein